MPRNIKDAFVEWSREKDAIVNVKLPRCVFPSHNRSNIQLHTFVDASQCAMCAVVYVRFVCEDSVCVNFIVGKCRVAPIRSSTIPKLELQAALIGMRLCASVKSFLPFVIELSGFWSDSSTIIH